MIVFEGELSEKCKEFVLNRESRNAFIAGAVVALPLLIANVILGIVHYVYLIALPLWVIFPFLMGIKPKAKSFQYILPKRIKISEETLDSEGESFHETKSISDIKEVINYGQFYQFIFKFPNKSNRFYCQKDLIVEGTLEEFEKLFEGKIVRKNNNEK